MKRLKLVPALVTAALMGVTLMSPVAAAAPAVPKAGGPDSFSVGPRTNVPMDVLKSGAKEEKPLGPTNLLKRDKKTGKLLSPVPRQGDDAVSVLDTLNFCYAATTDVPVRNAGGSAKGVRVVLTSTSSGEVRTLTTTARANYTTNVLFYGVFGGYSADLYVWDGAAYQYDGTVSGTNICAIEIGALCSRANPGYVEFTYRNVGTAYATVRTRREQPLIPSQWDDFPPPSGVDVTRLVKVRESVDPMVQYFITARSVGSTELQSQFIGYC